MNRLPDSVLRRTAAGDFERVATRRLQLGDVVRVLPGEAFPADGRILTGATQADEALLTGESTPVAKQPASPVTAGSYQPERGGRGGGGGTGRTDTFWPDRHADGKRLAAKTTPGAAGRPCRAAVSGRRAACCGAGRRLVVAHRSQPCADGRRGGAGGHLSLCAVAGHAGGHAHRCRHAGAQRSTGAQPAGAGGLSPLWIPWCSTRPAHSRATA
jgi:hypothetical protein